MTDNPTAKPEALTEQERFVQMASERSLGAPNVFFAHVLREGGNSWQPADLVWLGDDYIVLMYMTTKKKGGPGRNRRQASNWLSEWKNGRDLVVQNDFKTQTIPFGVHRHKVVLSVVGSPVRPASYDADFVRAHSGFGVTLYISVPPLLMEQFAGIGGSGADLVHLLINFAVNQERILQDRVPAGDVFGYFVQQNVRALAVLRSTRNPPTEEDVKAVLEAIHGANEGQDGTDPLHRLLINVRSAGIKTQDETSLIGVRNIINDLVLSDHYRLVMMLRDIIRHVQDAEMVSGERVSASTEISLSGYHIGLAVVPSLALVADPGKPSLEDVTSRLQHGMAGAAMGPLFRGAFSIIYARGEKQIVVVTHPRQSRSQAAEALDRWRTGVKREREWTHI